MAGRVKEVWQKFGRISEGFDSVTSRPRCDTLGHWPLEQFDFNVSGATSLQILPLKQFA